MKTLIKFIFFIVVGAHALNAQTQQHYSSSDIHNKIKKLNFLGSALYVGAHPDDENTSMISYLSNKTNAQVGYLSLTRGDGGQNLIGSEMRELLGVIRTQELLAARRIDGGEQFFSRANDFGFSKNPTETFEFWNRNKVLADVVWVFRTFKPDVVINRFNHRTEGDTHGHHTASAILSTEAFDLSGAEQEFTEQLAYTDAWQPQRLYFNDSWFFYGSKEKYQEADHSGFTELDLGAYLPVLGQSNNEISALSRSQHKSQGFGSAGERGVDNTYIEPIKGDFEGNDEDLFAGINTTWNRLEGGEAIADTLEKVEEDFDFEQPEKSLPQLLNAYKKIKELSDEHWREVKIKEIEEIIIASAGLYLEASTSEKQGTPGQEVPIAFEAINRSSADIQLKEIECSNGEKIFKTDTTLKNNKRYLKEEDLEVKEDLNYTSPYWLQEAHSLGMYEVDDQDMIGLPETPAQLIATFKLEVNGVALKIDRELIYKSTSQIEGERKEPFAIVPDASLAMNNKTLMFEDDAAKEIKVKIKAYKENLSGTLRLNHPEGWTVEPEEIDVEIDDKGSTKTEKFTIAPPQEEDEGELKPEFSTTENVFSDELHVLDYEHIPTKTVLLPAKTKVNRLAIKTKGNHIAYVKGAGDEMPQSLEEIGYQVTTLNAKDISSEELEKYDAVVLGIRIYNMEEDILLNQKALFAYVEQGGTLITQYSQLNGLITEEIAPYDLKLSDKRVTDEESDVQFLASDHPVLNQPNKITQTDFDNWVQERGLYFAEEWSNEFTPIFGMHDPDEDELEGSLLVADYGKGHFVYTGLSFFRQLPAGVPGAYRLFANILALGQEE